MRELLIARVVAVCQEPFVVTLAVPLHRRARAARHGQTRCSARRPRLYNSARRKSCALSATTIVLSDMSTAPMAGLNTTPTRASTPAASGMATML